ncbi:MAG: hypothetical protein K9J51_07805 [Desulfotignum sp.]|nr:hypothetical protein [Desulfotignum sp.]
MGNTLYTATGCTRCRIVASFMDDRDIAYEKSDILAEGKERFKTFYKEHRPEITRGPEGIEFPILFTGDAVIQGLGRILARLQAADALNAFVSTAASPPGWVSGLDLSARHLPDGSDLLAVVRFIKGKGLKMQLNTNGRNPHVLAALVKENLCDKIVFTLHGPATRYGKLTGLPLEESDLLQSLSLITAAENYNIILPVQPVTTTQGPGVSITPEEAAGAAALVEKATGSKNHPFLIQPLAPPPGSGLDALTSPQLFKYRTHCRRFMVRAEIMKTE